jgi:predicted xylose isomerase-like sugar epimerase
MPDSTGLLFALNQPRARGYRGPFSFEWTAPAFQAVANPQEAIAASIAHVRERLEAALES